MRAPARRTSGTRTRPAGAIALGLLALHFGSVALDEPAQGHTVLKLDLVLTHHWRSVGGHANQCAPGPGSGGEPG